MDIVLFRHAKKGLMPFEDPGLSPEGFTQSDLLPLTVQKHDLPPATALWTSEKIRTHQTFKGLASALGIKTTKRAELNLRADFETQNMFQNRVQSLIDELTLTSQKHSANDCIYLCTHYDWIEQSMTLINCDKDLNSFEFLHWSPAGHIVFEIQSNKWILINKGNV